MQPTLFLLYSSASCTTGCKSRGLGLLFFVCSVGLFLYVSLHLRIYQEKLWAEGFRAPDGYETTLVKLRFRFRFISIPASLAD